MIGYIALTASFFALPRQMLLFISAAVLNGFFLQGKNPLVIAATFLNQQFRSFSSFSVCSFMASASMISSKSPSMISGSR